jgi:hypothetical protein
VNGAFRPTVTLIDFDVVFYYALVSYCVVEFYCVVVNDCNAWYVRKT